jgi:hypothetical protein
MTRFRSLIALFALVVGAAIFPSAASADPSGPRTLTYVFTDCEGPAGTPAEFRAVKQPGEGAALHLTDGRGNFIAVRAVDVETGEVLFTTRGFERNGLATITCSLVNPRSGRTQLVTGLMTPVG